MFSITITPRFYETDAYGHINNTVVNCWFETARVSSPIFKPFIVGSDIKDMRVILARMAVDFVGQIYFGTDVEVRVFVKGLGNKSFVIGHEAYQNDKLVAKGEAVQVHFNLHEGQSLPLTEAQRTHLQSWIPNE